MPLPLIVPFVDARILLQGIPHQKCQNSISGYWDLYYDPTTRQMRDRAVCWLFCWATNGDGSVKAATAARNVFDQIFPMTYSAYDAMQTPVVAPLSTYEWSKGTKKHI
jgi:hypothetical protein